MGIKNTLKVMMAGFGVLMHRPLFKNYYRLALKHAMLRLGLVKDGYITIKCFDGSSTQTTLYTIGKLIYWYTYGDVKEIDCLHNNVRFYNGSLIPIDEVMLSDGIGDALSYGWRYDADNGYWTRGYVKFRHMHVPIIEVFNLKQYVFANVKDRVIVDVGAFVGDSAIYFVLRGAKKVYAVEPHPGAYREMLENIRLNNLEDRIIPINAALGDKRGVIKIPTVDVDSAGVMYYGLDSAGNAGSEVPVVTLSELIEEYNIEADVLKMDCEGCEYNVVLGDYAAISRFNDLIIEYHPHAVRWSSTEFMNKLKQDFKCVDESQDWHKALGVGIIHCIKDKALH